MIILAILAAFIAGALFSSGPRISRGGYQPRNPRPLTHPPQRLPKRSRTVFKDAADYHSSY